VEPSETPRGDIRRPPRQATRALWQRPRHRDGVAITVRHTMAKPPSGARLAALLALRDVIDEQSRDPGHSRLPSSIPDRGRFGRQMLLRFQATTGRLSPSTRRRCVGAVQGFFR